MQNIKSTSKRVAHPISNPGLTCEAVIIGGSAGAFKAVRNILLKLPDRFELPIIIVVHRHRHSNMDFEHQLGRDCPLKIVQADMQQPIQPSHVYVAPPNYHLLIEEDKSFSLSLESPVNYARPSIDVTFESAAQAFGSKLIGIILTGANKDGSNGLGEIKSHGGYTIVQSPETSEAAEMTSSAIDRVSPHQILDIDDIAPFLNRITTAGCDVESPP